MIIHNYLIGNMAITGLNVQFRGYKAERSENENPPKFSTKGDSRVYSWL